MAKETLWVTGDTSDFDKTVLETLEAKRIDSVYIIIIRMKLLFVLTPSVSVPHHDSLSVLSA